MYQPRHGSILEEVCRIGVSVCWVYHPTYVRYTGNMIEFTTRPLVTGNTHNSKNHSRAHSRCACSQNGQDLHLLLMGVKAKAFASASASS